MDTLEELRVRLKDLCEEFNYQEPDVDYWEIRHDLWNQISGVRASIRALEAQLAY